MKLDTITGFLKELRLAGMREHLAAVHDWAIAESADRLEFLGELLRLEIESRRINRTERFLRQSGLPMAKQMANFEQKNLSLKLRQQVKVLLEGTFLKRPENVLAFGPPGTGKTHLLCGLGRELIIQGHGVYFSPCNLLVQDLLRAKKELTLKKEFKKLARFKAIIIDDIGYVQQSREEMEVLFAFIADRYEHTSLMISSNLPFSKWGAIFKDPMTTAAAVDRLVHHSVILEMNHQSYRMEEAKKGKKMNENK